MGPPDGDMLDVFRLHGLLDSEHRPFGEHRAPGGVERWASTEYRPCPYEGSRRLNSRPMNVTALRQLAAEWPAILDLLGELRRKFLGSAAAAPAPFVALWQLTTALVSLPAYLVNRRDAAIRSGELPVAVAGLYKASLGVKVVLEIMVADMILTGAPEPAAVTANELLAFTESKSLFIGRSEVCAGPPRLVQEFLAGLIGESPAPSGGDVRVLVGLTAWPAFARHAGDIFAALLSACVIAGVLERRVTEARGRAWAWKDTAGPEQELAVTLGLRDLIRRLVACDAAARGRALRALRNLAGITCDDPLAHLAEVAAGAHDARNVYEALEVTAARQIDELRRSLADDLGWPPPRSLPFSLTGFCGLDVRTLLAQAGRETAPRRPAYAELWSSPALALVDYHDEEGRPAIAEALLGADARATLELRQCPYPDSRFRHELPMNRTALRQMAHHWDGMVGTLAVLQRMHAEARGGAPLTLVDLMQIAYAAAWLPLYLVLRRQRPLGDGEVPAFVSGLHKASVDVAATLQFMLLESLPVHSEPLAPTTSDVLGYVDRRGFLVGTSGVCAGPPALIIEYLTTLIKGDRRCDDMAAAVSALVDDVHAFRGYSRHVVRGALGKYGLWTAVLGLPSDSWALDAGMATKSAGPSATEIPGPIGRARQELLRLLCAEERGRLLVGLGGVIRALGSPGSAEFIPMSVPWPELAAAASAFFADNERSILTHLGHTPEVAPFGPREISALLAPLRQVSRCPVHGAADP